MGVSDILRVFKIARAEGDIYIFAPVLARLLVRHLVLLALTN